MTLLGKPLVFYLKHTAEMDRLYGDPEEGEKPDLTGLDDAEQVQEMVRIVGAAASEQAADFLELCGKGIEDHFTGLGIVALANKAKRATVVRNCDWYRKVHVTSVPDGWFYSGVFISGAGHPTFARASVEKDACGVVVPYLWSRGGRKGADAVWNILRNWPHSSAGVELGEDKRTIRLACIPIKAQPPESFDVDRDPLIDEVTKTIARIGAEQTKAIASAIAGLKEPDED